MKQPAYLSSFLFAALLFPGGAAFAAEAAEVTVNGIAIPRSRVDIAVENNVKQGQPNTPELRKRVVDALVTQEIVAQAAAAQGLDKDPLVAGRLDLLRQEVLINVLLVDYLAANPVSDEVLRAEYDKLKPLQPTREYKIRHIMTGTQEQATQLIAQLRKGASFEKLAAEHSADTPSRNQGGDLGWVTLDRLVPAIAEVVAKLQKGQISEAPVRGETAWHIVRLDEERPATVPTFDEAKQRVQQIVQGRIAEKLMSDLRAKAKIE